MNNTEETKERNMNNGQYTYILFFLGFIMGILIGGTIKEQEYHNQEVQLLHQILEKEAK